MGRAAFLEPDIKTSPERGLFPSITNFCISGVYFLECFPNILQANMAAFFAPASPMPIVATGTPPGSSAIERSESIPFSGEVGQELLLQVCLCMKL